jgi:hypothetical protein
MSALKALWHLDEAREDGSSNKKRVRDRAGMIASFYFARPIGSPRQIMPK